MGQFNTQTTPAWFIDPVNGLDTNAGTSSGAALKTYNELVARWGTYSPVLNQATTITWLNDAPASDPVICTPILNAPSGSITLLGTLTNVGSGTLGTITAKNRATGQKLNANLGQSPTSFVGLMLQNTTRSSWAWVDSVVSGNVVVLTQPMAQAFTAPSTFVTYPAENDSTTAGDSYIIWRPTQVNLVDFRPVANADSSGLLPIYLANLWLTDPGGVAASTIRIDGSIRNAVQFRCDRKLFLPGNESTGLEGGSITNAWLNAGVNSWGSANGPAIVGGAVNTSKVYNVSNLACVLDGDVYVHGNAVMVPPVAVVGAAYFDGSIVMYGQLQVSAALYGTPAMWGPGTLNVQVNSSLKYTAPAASALLLSGGYTINTLSTACAFDTSADPAVWHPGRTISAANLDATIASGGFNGAAIDPAIGGSITASGK